MNSSSRTIDDCISYDVQSTLITSSFGCTKCSDKYFLSDETGKCVLRENLPSRCVSYNPVKDECAECDNESYLFNSNKECKRAPRGILGCTGYSDLNTCTACEAGSYLDGNECKVADPGIDNCELYSSLINCLSCKTGFALLNNSCIKANAKDCVTYVNIDKCASCEPDKGLETVGDRIDCVTQTKSNCEVINDNKPYNCDKCEEKFYLEDGECKLPDEIANCLEYAKKEACLRCKKGYALSSDKTSCVNGGPIGELIPPNCQESKVVGTPVCSRCGPGYYLVKDVCEPLCKGESAVGCFVCSVETPETCFICLSGYYQDRHGNCIPVDDVITPSPKPDEPENPDGNGSDTVISVFSVLFFIFQFLSLRCY